MTARQPGNTRKVRRPNPIVLHPELGVPAIRCAMCEEVKPLEDFYADKKTPSGRSYRCKECSHSWRRDYMTRHPHKRRLYGQHENGCEVTQQWIDARLEEQGGLCAICHEAPATDVDHDHETGRPRAMLCNDCNTGIARLHEDPALMRAAADYIEEQKCLTT